MKWSNIIIWIVLSTLCLHIIIATAPTHTTPLLESDILNKNSFQNNLTSYNQSTNDADGDNVKNIYVFYVNQTPWANLIMPFEGDSTGAAALDHSGNNNDAVVNGAVWNETSGYDGFGAYTFNGTDHYMTIATSNGGDFDNDVFSLELRLFVNGSNNDTQRVFERGVNTYGIYVNSSGTGLTFYVDTSDNAGELQNITQGISTQQWYHIVGVFNSTHLLLYVDGALADTQPNSDSVVDNGGTSVYIGTNDTISEYFNGTIDELRYYPFVLTPEYILALNASIENTIENISLSVNDIWYGCVIPTDDNGSIGTRLCSERMYINGETNFYCFFNASSTCANGYLKILGAENDTGGYTNAHAQNYSLNTYQNSLCCKAQAGAMTFNCTEGPRFNLSDEDNAHAETDAFDTIGYNETICLSKTVHNMSCSFKGLCTVEETCLLTLSNQSGGTNAHISNCVDDTWWRLCCKDTNSPPEKVILQSPPNSTSTFNRSINFTWSAPVDPEGDTLSYQFNISYESALACGPDQVIDVGSVLIYEMIDLCVDNEINWSVRAYDGESYGPWSDSWNITVLSIVSINLTTDTVDFGSMDNLEINDTTDDDPASLVVENDGNVHVDVSLRADEALWDSVALDTSNFQTKADNTTEDNSFTWLTSATNWANVQAVYVSMIDALKKGVNNTAEIEVRVEVPQFEIAGDKEGTLRVYAVAD